MMESGRITLELGEWEVSREDDVELKRARGATAGQGPKVREGAGDSRWGGGTWRRVAGAVRGFLCTVVAAAIWL